MYDITNDIGTQYNGNEGSIADIYGGSLGNGKNSQISDLFKNTKDFRDVTKYNLMRGVPDFGSLVQFNPYETGYAAFIVCGMPKFIEVLAGINAS